MKEIQNSDVEYRSIDLNGRNIKYRKWKVKDKFRPR